MFGLKMYMLGKGSRGQSSGLEDSTGAPMLHLEVQSDGGAWHLFKWEDPLDSHPFSCCSRKAELAAILPGSSDQRQHPYSELKGLRCTGVGASMVRK